MKMREVVLRAIARRITWDQAADVLGISYPAMERLRRLYARRGYDGFWVRRFRGPRQKNVSLATIERVFLLYQERYSQVSVRSFSEMLHKRHGIDLSCEWVEQALNDAGLIEKTPGRQMHG
jgi:hypothetical protein